MVNKYKIAVFILGKDFLLKKWTNLGYKSININETFKSINNNQKIDYYYFFFLKYVFHQKIFFKILLV